MILPLISRLLVQTGRQSGLSSQPEHIRRAVDGSLRRLDTSYVDLWQVHTWSEQVPLDEIFMVPVRLDGCRVPRAIQREYQYLDLFPDWQRGLRRLLATMRKEVERRARRR